jgi:D-alanyl-D-alanine carboxypeptidase
VRRVALVAVALLALPAGAEAAIGPRQRAELAAVVRADMREGLVPGVTVGLWDPGRGTWARSFGQANPRSGRAMRRRDILRVGSITKTFTATVVLQLVQEGRLRLDQPIRRWGPAFPNAGRITNHTSGLFDPTNDDPAFERRLFAHPRRRVPPSEILRAAARHAPYFPPGQGWHYSNTNYLLLGRIVRAVSGHHVGAELRRRLLHPLGLTHTAYSTGTRVPAPRAAGFLQLLERRHPTTDWRFSWAGAAGALTSNPADLRRWAPVLATGRGILSRRMQRRRLQMVPTGSPHFTYGLGIFRDAGWLGHDGEVPGYAAIVLYHPGLRATLVVLENTSPDDDAYPAGHTAQAPIQIGTDVLSVLYPHGLPHVGTISRR